MATGIKCPRCGSTKVWAKGRVPKIGGAQPRYVCVDCGHTFYKPKAEAKPKVARTRKAKSSKSGKKSK